MRVLTLLAKPGLELQTAVSSADGMPLFGANTRLARRHLQALHEEGIRVLDVHADPRIEEWERIPTVDGFVRSLDSRFESVGKDRRMDVVKEAIRSVYLDFLFELGD
ncbi:MAG: hypothetical protein VX589_17080 [Myxococcota bacterium]|nr:hypothetical protein [Myxococcota bacterium]